MKGSKRAGATRRRHDRAFKLEAVRLWQSSGRPAEAIAQRLGICTRTIFRWVDAGMITRHKINARVVLFDEAEVIAFIESARV